MAAQVPIATDHSEAHTGAHNRERADLSATVLQPGWLTDFSIEPPKHRFSRVSDSVAQVKELLLGVYLSINGWTMVYLPLKV